MMTRSYRIQHSRDYISGYDFRLLLTGLPVGGYAAMRDNIGGKYPSQDAAAHDGAIFIETGLLPAFQTPERIEAYRSRMVVGRRAKAA